MLQFLSSRLLVISVVISYLIHRALKFKLYFFEFILLCSDGRVITVIKMSYISVIRYLLIVDIFF